MTTYFFDGTKNGLLTCIFESFYDRRIPDDVTTECVQCGLLDEIVTIKTDNEKAERVYKCLKNCKTKYLVSDFNLTFRSGEKKRFKVLFDYLNVAISNKNIDVSKAFALPEIQAFTDLKNRIYTETHRFKGFLRFMETEKGFYYACYEPDNDITELLIPHFTARLQSPFIIHDIKRNILALCDGKRYKILNGGDNGVTVFMSESEEIFLDLWQQYYKSINIEERKNLRQMRNYMPERYWKNLSEKQEKTEDF